MGCAQRRMRTMQGVKSVIWEAVSKLRIFISNNKILRGNLITFFKN
jgi:hypothetical protein